MTDEALQRLWVILDHERQSGPHQLSAPLIIELAQRNGIDFAATDLWNVASILGRSGGELLCPPLISDFITTMVKERGASDVLDPWVGWGTLLAPVVEGAKPTHFLGLHPSVDAIRTAEMLLPTAGRGEFRAIGPSEETLDGLGPFDLVVSAPPFNMKHRPFNVAGVEMNDGYGHELLVRSALKLRDLGNAIFVVASGFFFDSRPASVASNLCAVGLHVDAIFHVPGGTYRPLTSIECAIVVVRRGPPPEAVFVGEATQDESRLHELLSNYRSRRPGHSPELGAMVSLPRVHQGTVQADRVSESVALDASTLFPEFHGFRQLATDHRLSKATDRLRLPKYRMGTLCTSIARCSDSVNQAQDGGNSFFFPLIATSRVRLSRDDLSKGIREYAHVVVDPEKADARVVAGFFDSALGREIRLSRASGAVIQRISLADLANLPVWLPTHTKQLDIIAADQKVRSMLDELNEIREQLWRRLDQADEVGERLKRVNREDNFTEWLDTLPFPIASILWSAHALRDQPLRQYSQLEYFFEGLAEFLAILLLSGAQKDKSFLQEDWPQLRASLAKSHMTLERATFGTWTTIFESLAKRIRTVLGSGPGGGDDWRRRLACDDAEFLGSLVSKEMVNVLQQANKLRNDWRGHGGVVGEEEARRRWSRLNDLVLEVRRLIGTGWARYPLVLPGRGTFKGGTYHYGGQMVMGVRYPFEQADFELQAPMEDGVLHVVAPHAGHACALLPLVRMTSSPSDERNACYFYNRLDGAQLRYVSFHFESCPEKREPRGGALSVLDALLSPALRA